jgi:NAD(P)-dependent dehydrogenase (short-subunit alcohol dehydrogenase family)
VPNGETPGLAGAVAWVTGAAGGMGARHAQRLAAAGAAVGCIDRDQDGLAAVVERIRASGGTAEAAVADVSRWDEVSDAAGRLKRALGPARVAVANAGIVPGGAFVEHLDPSEWERVLAVNLSGVFHTAKAAIPQLREAGGGSLVLISSTAGLGAGPGYAAYYSSKHGVIGLMRTLANELAGEEIRVNAVCPGWVDTPMVDEQAADLGLSREAAAELFTADHLIKRLVTPDEVSDAVLWLASPQASMVTGVALPVDGGLLARTFTA